MSDQKNEPPQLFDWEHIKNYEILDENYPNIDICFKVIVIGNAGN